MPIEDSCVFLNTYSCATAATVEVIGGKWKAILIYQLLDGPLRFSELLKTSESISPRILTLQLRELEYDGLIQRVTYAEVPPRVEYSLTPLGETLRPLVLMMKQWATDHMSSVLEHRAAGELVR